MQGLLATAGENLVSPAILFFALGVVAGLVRSELAVPKELTAGLSLYLLLAIGFRGGAELAREGVSLAFLAAALAGLVLGLIVLPGVAFAALRKLGRVDPVNAGAIAAHYGSISVVTFATASTFLARAGVPHEGFMTAIMALMEAPGVLGGILLARMSGHQKPAEPGRIGAALRETLLGTAPTLLLGSLAIGALTGGKGMELMAPFLVDPFQGVLSVFLLDMGLTAGRRLGDFARMGRFLIFFGIAMPVLAGILGVLVARVVSLSVGGATLFAVLAASASYIAAPAAVRLALPQARPDLAITLSLGITFPFNILLGIPLYFALAHRIIQG